MDTSQAIDKVSLWDCLHLSCPVQFAACWTDGERSAEICGQVNIGSGNGLVPSGNKSLTEPMLTQSYAAIWRHQASMG